MVFTDVEQILAAVLQQDTRKRLEAGAQLIEFLLDDSQVIDFPPSLFEAFIDGLVHWVNSSNYKICLNGLECLGLVVDRLQDGFKPYITLISNAVTDRLGDSRTQVREQSQLLLQKLMDPGSSPQYILEKMTPAFQHKNFRVRDEVLICIKKTLDAFGSSSLTISKFVPFVCKLLADPNSQVRDTAVDTLVEIYRHVGEKVRIDISRRNVPSSKLTAIYARFDELARAGDLVDTASDYKTIDPFDYDSTSSSHNTSPVRGRSAATTPKVRSNFQSPISSRHASTENITGGSSTTRKFSSNQMKSKSSNADAGAVNEKSFLSSFNDFVNVHINSNRELQDILSDINNTLSNDKQDWELRVNALKQLRGVIHAGWCEFDTFPSQLKSLEMAFQSAIKDLRSQVCREACITASFLASTVGSKFDRFAETILPMLFQLLPNSAKVMATSGHTCILFIIKSVFSFRLIPVVASYVKSKSSVVRRKTLEFIVIILHTWPTHLLEKQVEVLEQTIKVGLADADSNARVEARRSFWGLANHFKTRADRMMLTLDSSKQKQLLAATEANGRGSYSSLLDSDDGATKLKTAAFERSTTARRSFMKPRTNLLTTYRDSEPDVTGRSKDDSSIHSSSIPSKPKLRTAVNKPSPAPATMKRIPRISQSQPSSRSNSPPRLPRPGPITKARSQKFAAPVTAAKLRTPSHPPRPKIKPPSKSASMKTLTRNNDVETHVWNALVKNRHQSDASIDGESDAGSIASESSVTKYNMGACEEVQVAIAKCNSLLWSERMQGLEQFITLLVGEQTLSHMDIRRMQDCLTHLLDEKHAQVYNKFLDVVCEFVSNNHADLKDWFFIAFAKLITRISNDMPSPVHTKLNDTLDTIRRIFPYDIQFIALVKFISENGDHINNKVKLSLLTYAREVLELMEPSIFVNSLDNRRALSRIITWSTDPKNVDIRKASNIIIISVFELNKSEFSALLSHLPKSFQEIASGMLQQYVDSGCREVPESPRAFNKVKNSPRAGVRNNAVNDNETSVTPFSKKHATDVLRLEQENASEGPIHSRDPASAAVMKHHGARTYAKEAYIDTSDSCENISQSRHDREYNPIHYQDENQPPSQSGNQILRNVNGSSDSSEVVSKLVRSLSTTLNSPEEANTVLKKLHKLLREDKNPSLWDRHAKGLITSLFQLNDLHSDEVTLRVSCFRVMKEIFNLQLAKLVELVKDIIHKFIEIEVNSEDREVSRASEDALLAYATSVPADIVLPTVGPVIEHFDYPSNLSALKLLNKVLEDLQDDELIPSLSEIMPGLIKSFQHSESSVRKACVFCLVAIHKIIGEKLQPYLSALSGSQVKLLNLYIKRSQTQLTVSADARNC